MTIKRRIISNAVFVTVLAIVSCVITFYQTKHVRDRYPKKILAWNKEVKILTKVKTALHQLEIDLVKSTYLSSALKSNKIENLVSFITIKNNIVKYQQLGVRQAKEAQKINAEVEAIASLSKKENLQFLNKIEKLEAKYQSISQIITNSKQVGYQECELVRASVAKSNSTILVVTFVAFLLIVLLSIVFAIRATTQLQESVSELKSMARRIMSGDFSPVSKHHRKKDELSAIGMSFNTIAEDLQKSKTIEEQNQQLELLNDQLQIKNKSLDKFVYRVSHDLRAPVLNIESLLKLVKAKVKVENESTAQALSFLEKSTRKLKQTIFDLLEVSRIERSLKSKKEWINLEQAFAYTLEKYEENITLHRIKVTSDFAVKEIFFAAMNFNSILSNLISNGIKYRSSDRPAFIHISSSQQDNGFVCLTVKDNGVGLDVEKHKDKLFEMFNRFHDHIEGSGVGLYIIKQIIEEAGGKVEVESTVGIGTTFRIFIKHEEVAELV